MAIRIACSFCNLPWSIVFEIHMDAFGMEHVPNESTKNSIVFVHFSVKNLKIAWFVLYVYVVFGCFYTVDIADRFLPRQNRIKFLSIHETNCQIGFDNKYIP